MMRRLLLLSIAALLATCSSNKEFNTNRYQMNGNVLSVKVVSYDATTRFGEVVKEDADDYNDCVVYRLNNQHLIEAESHFYYSTYRDRDILTMMTKRAYDGERLLSEEQYDDDGDLEMKHTYKYDGDKVTSIVKYNNESEVIEKSLYTYDGDHQSIVVYDDEGEVIRRIESTFDGKELVSETIYDATGQKTLVCTLSKSGDAYTYNYEDLAADNIYSYTSKSDKHGRLIYIAHSTNMGTEELFIEYDKHGNATICRGGETSLDGRYFLVEDGVDSYYEYKYDSHNNWIERIGYHGETRMPFEIVERTIEYRK